MMLTLARILAGLAFLAREAVTGIVGNIGLAVLSLLLSVSLWLFVTDRENPREVQTFNRSIPIELVNVPEDLAVANVAEAGVRIRIEAPRNELDRLESDDFQAQADLGGLTSGTHDVAVEVTPPNSRIDVVEVTPARVNVTLESRRSKEVPVRVETVGSVQTGFGIAGERADPETVTVSGPQSLVELVESAVAVVNVAGQRVDVDGERVRLEPRDARNGGISRVTVTPDSARISVDVEQREYTLEFAVSPVISGQPAQGYNVAGITVDPRLVLVTGSLDVLQSIDAVRGINTAEISIADERDDVIRTVELSLPAGTRVQGSTTVRVTIDINPAQAQFSFRVVPRIENLAGGMNATVAGPVTVTLTGDAPTLQSLTAEQIDAVADAEGLGPGLHLLPVSVRPPSGASVFRVDPAEVGAAITLAE